MICGVDSHHMEGATWRGSQELWWDVLAEEDPIQQPNKTFSLICEFSAWGDLVSNIQKAAVIHTALSSCLITLQLLLNARRNEGGKDQKQHWVRSVMKLHAFFFSQGGGCPKATNSWFAPFVRPLFFFYVFVVGVEKVKSPAGARSALSRWQMFPLVYQIQYIYCCSIYC